jgi:hypothetical protein
MKRNNIIVGFGHRRRRGKDLCCELALEHLKLKDVPARIDHFAHSLKEGIGRGVFGLTDEQLYGDLKEVEDPFWGMTPGKLLQIAGTECMRRGMGDSIWVRTLRRRLLEQPQVGLLIGDMRFPNEAEAIKSWGGILVKVNRRGLPPTSRDNHISETALDNYDGWDYEIDNCGDRQHLAGLVVEIIEAQL